jgi:hypothetical protein
MNMSHPSDDDLRAVVTAIRRLDSLVPFDEVLSHADGCAQCGDRLVALAGGAA